MELFSTSYSSLAFKLVIFFFFHCKEGKQIATQREELLS